MINIIYLIKFLRKLVKYQLLRHFNNKKIPLKIKIILFCIAPIYSIKKKEYKASKAIKLFLTENGPIFIKLGQMLATRPDIIGTNIAHELESLQDKMPAFNFSETIKTFNQDLKINPINEFNEVTKIPEASASVAQVYKWKTKNNNKIAVKILRPNIREEYQANINFLFFIAKLSKYFSFFKNLRPIELINNFQNIMQKELNMNVEASIIEEFKENLKNNNNIIIPKIYWDYVSNNIIIMSWIEGTPINKINIKNYKTEILDQISENLAHSFFQQAFYHGLFHADLHHGNIFIVDNHKIGLIDFGITSRLIEKDKIAVAEILYCFIKKKYNRITEIHIEQNIIPSNVDKDLFTAYTRKIGQKIIGIPISKISFANLIKELMIIINKFNVKTQPQLFFLQKTMLTVEGIGQKLSPDYNIWQMIDKDIKKWAIKNISPEAKLLKKLKRIFDI